MVHIPASDFFGWWSGPEPRGGTVSVDTKFTRVSPGSVRLVDASDSLANLSLGQLTANSIALAGEITTYNGVATAGWGMPAIMASNFIPGLQAAAPSIVTHTPTTDGVFLIESHIYATAVGICTVALQVTYTDHNGTAHTASIDLSQDDATQHSAITNGTGTGAYYGQSLYIRAKAAKAITVLTSGTFTSITYDVGATIKRDA